MPEASPNHVQFRYVSQSAVAWYPPGATFGPRELRDYELVWMIEGDAVYRRGDESFDAPAGSIVLCRPCESDGFRWDIKRQTRHGYVHFQLSETPSEWPPQHEWASVRILPAADLLRPLFRHLLAWQGRETEAQSQLTVEHLLTSFVTGHVATDPVPRDVLPEPVATAQQFIRRSLKQNAATPLTLAQIASAASVSAEHLCRVFKAATGHSPMAAVRLMRLDNAANLLMRTNFTVGEVSDLCGFANAFHFSRVFKEAFGHSPSEMRAAVKSGTISQVPRLMPTSESWSVD